MKGPTLSVTVPSSGGPAVRSEENVFLFFKHCLPLGLLSEFLYSVWKLIYAAAAAAAAAAVPVMPSSADIRT